MKSSCVVVGILVFSSVAAQARLVHHSVLQTPVRSLDPLYSADTNSQLVITNSFDGLVRWTAQDGITPALAASWGFSPDNKTISFALRRGARFHDGTPVTGRDVVKHFHRLRGYHGYYSSHFANIQSVEATSADRVVFHLKKTNTHFLQLLSGVAGRIVKLKGSSDVVGSGPFVPVVSVDGRKVILTRDPRYWGLAPSVERIEFRVADEAAAMALARQGGLDDLAIFGLKQASYDKIPPGKRLRQSLWATWAIAFDQRVPPFERAAIRRSLAARIGSEEWVRDLFPEQMRADGLLPFGMPGHIGKPVGNSGALLERDRAACGSIQPCRVLIEIPDVLETRDDISGWIQAKTAGMSGVSVAVRASAFDSMMARYASGVMGAYLVSFNAEYPDPAFLLRALRSDSRSNFLGINAREIDGWIEQADSEADPARRAEIFERFNAYLIQQAALIPLMHITHKTWARDCVDGLGLNPVGEGYFDYRAVRNSCP